MSHLVVHFDEAQLDDLADRIAKRIGGPLTNKPFSLKEAGIALGVSSETIRLRVESGRIAKIPGMGRRVLIPRSEIERLQFAKSKS